jgi:type IV pilus assembly protein PilA
MLKQLRSQKGLTLVELMVVVAIIAIIAAVAITVFQDIQKKAKLAADQANVAAMRSAVAIYYGKNNGIFPGGVTKVYSLVTPAIDDNSFHCQTTPQYTPGNGKVDYSANIDNCTN